MSWSLVLRFVCVSYCLLIGHQHWTWIPFCRKLTTWYGASSNLAISYIRSMSNVLRSPIYTDCRAEISLLYRSVSAQNLFIDLFLTSFRDSFFGDDIWKQVSGHDHPTSYLFAKLTMRVRLGLVFFCEENNYVNNRAFLQKTDLVVCLKMADDTVKSNIGTFPGQKTYKQIHLLGNTQRHVSALRRNKLGTAIRSLLSNIPWA